MRSRIELDVMRRHRTTVKLSGTVSISMGSIMPPPMIMSRLLQPDFIFEHHRQSSMAVSPQSFLMHSVSIQLDPAKVEVSCGEKRTRVTLRRGDMTIAPYRFSIDEAHVEPCEFLQLHLSPSVIDRPP